MAELTAEDRRLLGDNIERFAARHYAADQRRRILAGEGHNRSVWEGAAELGLLGLGLPESHGGVGGSLRDLGTVMSAVGRHLMLEPFLNTAVLCAPLIAALDPSASIHDLGAAISGTVIFALAHAEPQLGFARFPLATAALPSPNGPLLTGRKSFVLDGPIADTLVVTARRPDATLGAFLVAADDVHVATRRFRSIDGRWCADLELRSAPAVALGDGDARPAIEATLDRAAIALGFEAVGSMTRLVEDTGAHLRTRRAFGGTLSQLQVLQHRLVDMLLLVKETEAIVEAAAAAYDEQQPTRAELAAAAKLFTCRACRAVAEGAVQLHGGLGVSDELAVSHHFKRLMMVEALHGDAEHHLDRFIELSSQT